jgi:hypothetical protein
MTIQPLTASLPVELILHLTGVYVPTARADVGQPEGGDTIEDIAIEGLSYEVITYEALYTMSAKRLTRHTNLLANVDTSNPHVQTLLSNLLSAVEAAAGEALMGEVE